MEWVLIVVDLWDTMFNEKKKKSPKITEVYFSKWWKNKHYIFCELESWFLFKLYYNKAVYNNVFRNKFLFFMLDNYFLPIVSWELFMRVTLNYEILYLLRLKEEAAKAAFEKRDLAALNQIQNTCGVMERTLSDKITSMKSQLSAKR